MNKGQKYIVKENFNLTHLYTKPDKWQVRKGEDRAYIDDLIYVGE